MQIPPQDRPPEAVDDSDHRIERIEQPPLPGDHAAAESDRGDVQAELGDERHNIPEIAVLDVQGGQPQPETEGGEKRHAQKNGQGEDPPARDEPGPGHEDPQDHEGDQEVDQVDDDRAGRDDQAGEVDFREHVGIRDERIAALGEGAGKELPREHRRNDQDRIGDPFGRQLRQVTEDDREDDHRQQRAEDPPGDADGRLLIADEDVPPGEEVKQLPALPQIAPVVTEASSGLYDKVELRARSLGCQVI